MNPEPRNPWITHRSESRYDNPWIEVTEHQVTNPAGGAGIYGVVHMKNLGTGVVVLDEQDRTILVGQWRYTLNRFSWEIPEGGGDPALDPLVSAQRELLEETGLLADDWQKIQVMHTSNSVTDEVAHIFLARRVRQVQAPSPEATEDIQVRWLPFEDAVAMVKRNEITDSMAVAGLLRVHLMRMEGELPRTRDGGAPGFAGI